MRTITISITAEDMAHLKAVTATFPTSQNKLAARALALGLAQLERDPAALRKVAP